MTGVAINQMAIRRSLSTGVCLTINELDTRLVNIKRCEIIKSVGNMISNGYAERVERGCYQLTPKGLRSADKNEVLTSGPKGPDSSAARKPIPDTIRQRAWNVMRLPGSFTIPDLITIVVINGETGAADNLQKYCKTLATAGYLMILADRAKGTRPGSNGFIRYRLIKDTGEIAPVIRPKTKTLYDHNLGEEVSCK